MSPLSPPRIRLLATAALAALLSACQATDPAFLTAEGRLVRDVDPIPFRVAVAPLTLASGVTLQQPDASGLQFCLDQGALRSRLVAELRTQRTATEILEVGEPSLEAAKTARADLLLRPRVTAVRIAHLGSSKDQLLSSFLWLTTWVGGMFVADSTYDARLEIEWDIVNPFDNRSVDRVVASSEQVDLTWWQRNAFLSLPLIQTLVLPPVLTSDSDARTSESLTEVASSRVAARLACYLKAGFGREARDVLGELRIDAPRNGTAIGTDSRLRARIVARGPVTAINVYVNEKPVLVLSGKQIAPAVEQSRGSTFQLGIDHPLELRAGPNLVAIEFAVRGSFTSRTLVVQGPQNTNPAARGLEVSQR